MSITKGKLQIKSSKTSKIFMVVLPTKKGEASFPVPSLAKCFQDADAIDGMEVDVERDEKNAIVKVLIPGKEQVVGKPVGHGQRDINRGYRNPHGPSKSSAPITPTANTKEIGLPFHNPYTFIEFSTTQDSRERPTRRISDEEANSPRFTGIFELEVRTKSPLLTSQAIRDKANGHQNYNALTIGDDVIVPATGVRGALRYLLTVLTGGPLSVVDNEMYLCQQRDLPMGVNPTAQQKPCCLARVVTAGSSKQSGTVQLGETRLVKVALLNKLNKELNVEKTRPTTGNQALWIDDPASPTKWSSTPSVDCPWQVKLSGRPVNTKPKKVYINDATSPTVWSGQKTTVCKVEVFCSYNKSDRTNIAKVNGRPISLPPEFWDAWTVGFKKEGAFKASDSTTLELGKEFWQAYENRNRHGARKALKANDLIWLELKCDPQGKTPEQDDIVSIQWARWGRSGTKLTEVLPNTVLPDYTKEDGLVSTVTDLFGQVPVNAEAPLFASRIRPDNLVFKNGRNNLTECVPLAVLSSPHPGCLPFYRKGDAATLSRKNPLKGYKVYRTSKHNAETTDDAAPWKYASQGVYDEHGALQSDGSNAAVNFSAQLLKPDAVGTLRLSLRSLSWEELSLLRLVCDNATWRLGGGKPLGLGHCEITIHKIIDEFGIEITKDDSRFVKISENITHRLTLWNATQNPVEILRYPRAAISNRNKITRGGLSWFQKFASPKKDQQGMQTFKFGSKIVDGQMLPEFSVRGDDLLFGYDAFLDDDQRNEFAYPDPIELFDPSQHVTGHEKTGGFHGQDRQTRKDDRSRR